LESIFPNSVVRDKIFQHQTSNEFNSFSGDKISNGRLGEGYYFSDFGNDYIDSKFNLIKKLVCLDIKNLSNFLVRPSVL